MKKRVRLYKAQEGMQVQDPQQLQQMLVAQVQSDMQQGVPREQTVLTIYNAYQNMFNNPVEVQQFVDSIYQSMTQQEEVADDEMAEEQVDEQAEALQDEMMAQQEGSDEELAEAQMGMNVSTPTYFTGIEAYVPENYVDMMSNPAFAYGGQKSKYIKDRLALVKKQMGGQDNVTESTSVDEIGESQRKNSLKNFIDIVKNTSALANAQKQAEMEYDQMMAQMGGEEQDFTHYTHGADDIFHDEMNYLAQAQFGGISPRQQRQMQKSMSRIPFGAVPTTPVEKIDVRKTGMFGRPKEYSIEFASPLQAIGAPGAASAYGYGINQSASRKTEGKKGTVAIQGTPGKTTTTPASTTPASTTPAESTTSGGTGGTGSGQGTGTGKTTEDNTIPQTVTPKKGATYQYIPGRPFAYTQAENGDWLYKKSEDEDWKTVTNLDALATLNTGQSKSGQLVTLSGKEGYYYRLRNDGSYIKFKGDPKQHYEGKAPVKAGDKPIVIKPGDKTYDYLNKNSTWLLKPYIPNVAEKPEQPQKKTTAQEWQEQVDKQSQKFKEYQDLPWYEKLMTTNPNTEMFPAAGVPGFMEYGLAPTSFSYTIPGAAIPGLGQGAAQNLLGRGQNALNPGQGMLNPGQGMLNPGQPMLNPGQGLLNPPPGFQYRLFEDGGNIMNPMSDMYGNLQRFVYGGGEDPSVANINQADINYTNSKDTSDPYFAFGGMTQYAEGDEVTENPEEDVTEKFDFTVTNKDKAINQVNPLYQSDARTVDVLRGMDQARERQQQFNPYSQFGYNPMMGYPGAGMFNNGSMAPWYAGSWNQVQRGPYTKSGQTFNPAGYGTTGAISNINVTKSSLMGRPKKYSITYSNPNQLAPMGSTTPGAKPGAPTKSATEPNKEKDPRFSNTEGLNPFTRGKIALNEFVNNAQTARGERKFGTAEEQARAYEKANPMQRMATNPLNKMRVSSSANQAPMSRMSTLPAFLGGKLRGAQYGGMMEYADGNEVTTPVDQDERFQPLPTKSAQTVGNELMMQSRKNIADQAEFLPEEYTVDYKVKNAFNVNYPMALNAANAIGNVGASFLENRGKQYQGALTQEEMTGTDARKFAGNFTEYGEFRPDLQGNKSNSAFSKYGGATEGDELYMTEEEIERFLAEGGELEYL
jgi:hypothetical protein